MMKKTAGIGLMAAVGFSAFAASPALASPYSFDNCEQAAAAGFHDIQAGTVQYAFHLDQDKDGVACESGNGEGPYVPPVNDVTSIEVPADGTQSQVGQMPVGGADTGVPQQVHDDSGAIALGSGLVLAAAVGGVYVVRRRVSRA